MPAETWKPVPGYKGLYEVSSLGRVRSLDRRVVYNSKYGKRRVWRRGQLMKATQAGYRDGSQGCMQVSLSRNGEMESRVVSTLVLKVFGHSAPKFSKCIHYDNDFTNNALRNIDFRPLKKRRANGKR